MGNGRTNRETENDGIESQTNGKIESLFFKIHRGMLL